MRSAIRRYLIPALSTSIMLIVLVGLGTWQVYRLHWKQRVLARIAAAEAAPAVPLATDPAPYAKVYVTGHFMFDKAAEFGAEVRDTPAGPTLGSYLLVPLDRPDGSPVLVERGWVPQKRGAPLDDPAGVVTVTGFVQARQQRSWFSAPDDPATRQFYTLDPEAIGAAVGVSGLAPFTLVAIGHATAGAYPAPAVHLPQPPNNHLSYAITWYGLAVSLILIFIFWVRKALRA